MCENTLSPKSITDLNKKEKPTESSCQTGSVKKKNNPQAIYAKNLLDWNALLITLAKQTEELQEAEEKKLAEEQIHAERAHAYLINLLDKKQKNLLETTDQLGLKRERARIEKQYTPIAPPLDKSTSHEDSKKETKSQNPPKNSNSLNAFNLDNACDILAETNWMRLYLLRINRLFSTTSLVAHNAKLNKILKSANNTLNLDNARDILVETNWMRLYLLRINRLFSAISLVAHNAKLNEMLKSANSVLHPIFNILSWAYYLPRLTINLAMLMKHTVPNHWMNKQEKQVSLRERLKAQWDRRWSALLNDGVWCAVGITTCFFLTGPNAMLLIVALYIFDVVNISAKAYVDIRLYNKLIQETENEITGLKSETQIKVKKDFLKELQTLKKKQCKSSALNVGTAIGLLVGMIFFIPALAACPVIPVIGASIVMATCITYIFLKKVFIHSPEALVPKKLELNPQRFLAKKEDEQNNNTTIPDALQSSAPRLA